MPGELRARQAVTAQGLIPWLTSLTATPPSRAPPRQGNEPVVAGQGVMFEDLEGMEEGGSSDEEAEQLLWEAGLMHQGGANVAVAPAGVGRPDRTRGRCRLYVQLGRPCSGEDRERGPIPCPRALPALAPHPAPQGCPASAQVRSWRLLWPSPKSTLPRRSCIPHTRPGNVLLVKLIDQENLMDLYGDEHGCAATAAAFGCLEAPGAAMMAWPPRCLHFLPSDCLLTFSRPPFPLQLAQH